MDTDILAEDLVSGRRSCSSCSALTDLVEQVRNDKLSMEDFKRILKQNANVSLKGMT